MEAKKFDLNIEKILEHWEVYDAIREIIANALDEQILTSTDEIKIFKDFKGRWHIKDFGRGLKYQHLTQKEDREKLNTPNIIGKFGIGLKDALATFDRKGVKLEIKSRYGDIIIEKSQKHSFDDVLTLHAIIKDPSDSNLIGTEFILEDVEDNDIERAKDLFLKFSGEKLIEKTKYGDVLDKKEQNARIYINGVKVAEESNFLFSYNITSLTEKIRNALNRERANVGRGAYSDRVKSILLTCTSKEVANLLVEDLKKYSFGEMKDELNWIDVQEHAVKILSTKEKTVFLSPEESMTHTDMVDEAISKDYKIITIPQNLRERIRDSRDLHDEKIRELDQFYEEYHKSFEFKFVDTTKLNSSEKVVYNMTDNIYFLIGGRPQGIKEIKISETMRKELGSTEETVGFWDSSNRRIIIRRDQLCSLDKYAGTLIHETAHALSGATDVSRTFEKELTKLIGTIISKIKFR